MTIKKQKGSNKKTGLCKLKFTGNMTIYEAEEIQRELLDYLSTYKKFHLDLSEVDDIDSAGLQILLYFQNKIETTGKQLVDVQYSDQILQLIDLFHLSEKLKPLAA